MTDQEQEPVWRAGYLEGTLDERARVVRMLDDQLMSCEQALREGPDRDAERAAGLLRWLLERVRQ